MIRWVSPVTTLAAQLMPDDAVTPDGHTVEEVAKRIGFAPRSVKRKLQLIRTIWEPEVVDERT